MSKSRKSPECPRLPKVTFVVFSYNQERYVADAILGAFSQTYKNLEIIISDDCSTDKTFNVIQASVDRYSGANSVIVNRNSSNLNVAAHIKKVSEIASGEIIVMAAGDDISMPNRTSTIVEKFRCDMSVHAVFSDMLFIDDASHALGESRFGLQAADRIGLYSMIRNGGGVGTGATYAYRSECFSWPWPYPAFFLNEDRLLPLRAMLLGRVVHISEPLVKYRVSATGAFRSKDPTAVQARYNHVYASEIERTLKQAVLEKRLNRILGIVYRRLALLVPTIMNAIYRGQSSRSLLGRLRAGMLYDLLFFDASCARQIKKCQALFVKLSKNRKGSLR